VGDYLTGDSHQGDCSPGQSTRDTIGRRGRPALANLPSSSPSCAVLKPPATLPAEGRNSPWRPGFLSFGCVLLLYLVIGWKTSRNPYQHQFLSWYTSVVWTLPFLTSALGLTGVLVTARRVRGGRLITETPAAVTDLLLVVVPSIGREDTCPALERVLTSFGRHLPCLFPSMRVDLVVEEDCVASERISRLAAAHEATEVRVVSIPREYQTPAGTRFKARANHYAHELRIAQGEARENVWVLHMDDDTAVGADTAQALARFIGAHGAAGKEARHLAQGVLSFPRELSANRLIWLADAVRPGCDISIFAATTGLGSPRAGLHGELLLVRASVEASIGWDFGASAIVEDAQFALEFCARYPGSSDWIEGRSYGAPPATLADFLRQRERWFWGLLRLATDRATPLRGRLVLLQAVAVWMCAPLQHPVLVIGLGLMLHETSTGPVSVAIVPLWSVNFAFLFWLYWEGLKVNASASARTGRLWWEPVTLVLLLPVFSLWEGLGVARGMLKFISRRDMTFTVIAKPA